MRTSIVVVSMVLALLVGAWEAWAQSNPEHLVVSITLPESEPQTGWARIWAFLKTKALPRPRPPIGTKFTVESSAYASSPRQTDATPCITAAGTRVRPGVVASNFLPLGTLLDINGQEFIVEDRMNSRYKGNYMDLWFESTEAALKFGRKKLEITITGYTDPGTPIRNEKKMEETVMQPTGRIRKIVSAMSSFLTARVLTNVNKDDVSCF